MRQVKAAVQNEAFEIHVGANETVYFEKTMLFLCVLTDSVGSFRAINEQADASDGLLHGFKANKSLSLNVDGDLIGEVPATISILHNHLEFFVQG